MHYLCTFVTGFLTNVQDFPRCSRGKWKNCHHVISHHRHGKYKQTLKAYLRLFNCRENSHPTVLTGISRPDGVTVRSTGIFSSNIRAYVPIGIYYITFLRESFKAFTQNSQREFLVFFWIFLSKILC